MSRLKIATLDWLQYEIPKKKDDNSDLFTDFENPPEQPEILMMIRRSKRLGIPLFDGGYYEQPYCLLEEWALVTRLEDEFEQNRKLNEVLAKLHQGGQSSPDTGRG